MPNLIKDNRIIAAQVDNTLKYLNQNLFQKIENKDIKHFLATQKR